MIKKYLIALLISLIYLTKVSSQISEQGFPESFKLANKSDEIIPEKILDPIDTGKLLSEDRKEGIPNRFGVLQSLNINIKSEGLKTIIPGKGTIWRYKIKSTGTYSLGIQFSRYWLPDDAKVFIYDENKNQIAGAFTNVNNNDNQQLAIAEFFSDNAIIEYFEPSEAEFDGELNIGSVSQSYKNLMSILQTFVDVNCPPGANWQIEKRAVCRMTFHDTQYEYFCSGSLLNNVRDDGTPYFLTANHCLSSNILASTLVVYFNYETDTCNGIYKGIKQTILGSIIVATNNYSDFSLLKLNKMPPSSYNACYAGWDASNRESQNAICISHPGGGLKTIAIDYNPPTTLNSEIYWNDSGTSMPGSHWAVQYNVGYDSAGSSGGPLFDDHKRIIGQLHGGSALTAYFGKFAISWDHSSNINAQLAYWLDPDTTKIMAIDSKFIPLPDFKVSLTNVCIGDSVKFTNTSQYVTSQPIQWKWKIKPSTYNFVNSTDSSQSPEISFLGTGKYSISLVAITANGSDSITKNNYITSGKTLNVKLYNLASDSSFCGSGFMNVPLVASGAINYSFSVKNTDKINYQINNDSIFLSLKPGVQIPGSINTFVKVTGSYGSCSASDSVKLIINAPANDNIAYATDSSFELKLGINGPFSNYCASVETNEPHPDIGNCISSNSWCADTNNSGTFLHNTVWFTFRDPAFGRLNIDTYGFDDRICVYDASSSNNILSGNPALYKIVAANDNRSASNTGALLQKLRLTPGKLYWLQVDGDNGSVGNFYINLYTNDLEIYPNPTSGKFNVIISYPKNGTALLKIFSSIGSLMLMKPVAVTNEANPINLDISCFSDGIYYMQVQIDNFVMSEKIMLIK